MRQELAGKKKIIDGLEEAIRESLQSREVKSRLFSKSVFSLTSGSSDVDNGRLMEGLQPLRVELERLDAELFLKLENVKQDGACLCRNVQVRPIHDDISPPRDAIRYLRVADQEEYSIGVFIFPPFARMPMHDHPGMCVLSRLLYGDVQRTQLDFAPPSRWSFRRRLVAHRHEPDHLHAPACVELFPVKGNLHEFVAGPNGAAMLDVLIPPYDDERDCTFYKVEDHLEEGSMRCYVSILPDQSDEFPCISGQYSGWEDE